MRKIINLFVKVNSITKNPEEIISRIYAEKINHLKGGGDDFKGALNRLMGNWNSPSSFFTEILQNANDASATSIEFIMKENGILVIHNGHVFTESEVVSICSIDKSTKKIETDTGYMGIGFKSIFSISESPYIVSGQWKFQFSKKEYFSEDLGWIILPHWCHKMPNEIINFDNDKTVFWIPFKRDLSVNSIKEIEETMFERFNRICLFFLKNINEINIRKEKKIRHLSLISDSEIKEIHEEKISTYKYKIFKNKYEVPPIIKTDYETKKNERTNATSREVVIVFYLDEEGHLKPQKNLPVYVNLPTNQKFNLRFAVQADFILDSGRSYILNIEWNRWLWGCVKDLLISSIEGYANGELYCLGFKEDALLKYQFYKILPTKKDISSEENNLFFNEFIEPFFEYCSEHPIAITDGEKWVKASKAIFASKELRELLDIDKLRSLEGKDELCYIDLRVKDAETFLKDFGSREIEDNYIVETLKDCEWLESKSISWFNDLYRFLCGAINNNWFYSIRYRLTDLPLILTNSGIKKISEVFLYPKEENEKLVALGIPNIHFPDERILNEYSDKLFNELGVKEFNEANIIENLILKSFENGEFESWNNEQRQKCYYFILHWLNSNKWDIPGEIKFKLNKVLIKTEKDELKRAYKCYYPLNELRILLNNVDFAKLNEVENKEFYEFIGLNTRPRIIVDEDTYSKYSPPSVISSFGEYWDWLEKNKINENEYHAELKEIKYCDNWDNISWDEKKSKLMINYLINNWDYYKNYLDTKLNYKAHWKSNAIWHSRSVSSYFRWQLKNTLWIATTKGLKSPSDNIFLPTRDIKEMAGDYVEYILMPDKYKKESSQQLFNYLDINTSLDLDNMRHILERFEMYKISDEIKNKISKIYRWLGNKVVTDNEMELNPFKVLTISGKYILSNESLWNDDTEFGNHFENIGFIWAPEDVERPYIEALFHKIGVKKISEYLRREMKEIDSKTDAIRKENINAKIDLIYSIIKHFNPKCTEIDINTLRCLDIRKVNQGKIPLTLILEKEIREINVDIFYNRGNNTLYMGEDCSNENLAFEFARMAKLDISCSSCFELILPLDYQEAERKLKRLGIGILEDNSPSIEYKKGTELIESEVMIDNDQIPTESTQKNKIPSENIEDIVKIIEPNPNIKDNGVETFRITTAVGDNESEIKKEVDEIQKTDEEDEDIDAEWHPQSSPGEAEIKILEYVPPESSKNDAPDIPTRKSQIRGITAARNRCDNQKPIGRWGEKYSFICLKDKYPDSEISWLNEEKDTGIGHDIEINCKDRIIYVEVKSTSTLESNEFVITRQEWELMLKEKNNFWLCRIYGAGTKTPYMKIIKNPYSLWKEEKILIEPVQLKLIV